jgi:TPR repeat protein
VAIAKKKGNDAIEGRTLAARVLRGLLTGAAIAVMLAGCAATTPAPETAQQSPGSRPAQTSSPSTAQRRPPITEFDRIVAAVRRGDLSRAPQLRPALLADPRMNERIREETEALVAMLDAEDRGEDPMPYLERALAANYSSLVSHYHAMLYADFADDFERAALHETVLGALFDTVGTTGDGTRAAPFLVVNFDEIELIAMLLDVEVIASQMLMQNEQVLVEVFTVDSSSATQTRYFDLSPALTGSLRRIGTASDAEFGLGFRQRIRLQVIVALAEQGITAAQAAFGAWAIKTRNPQTLERAVELLESHDISENAAAVLALASVQATLSRLADDPQPLRERALDLIFDAIEAGYAPATTALFELSTIGMTPGFSPADVWPLLRQCAPRDARCTLRAALVHLDDAPPDIGIVLDASTGWALMREAALAGNDAAIAYYAGHMLSTDHADHADDADRRAALELLMGAAESGLPFASVVLAKLHREGSTVKRDIDRAKDLLRRGLAFNLDANHRYVHDVVKELVSGSDAAFHDPSLAAGLMDALMVRIPYIHSEPEYLETFAIALSAAGDQANAETQMRRALELAASQNADPDLIAALEWQVGRIERGEPIHPLVH